MVLPFPLFHGTSSIFLPSIRRHGLGGKNIILEWRVLEFLCITMKELDRYIDRSSAEVQMHWPILEAAKVQRVDHFNWRYGTTYLTASMSKAVMYATASRFGSELIQLVSWLIAQCPPDHRPALDLTLEHYPELAQCLSMTGEPLLIRAERVPVNSLRTEEGEDASGLVRKLIDAHDTKTPRYFAAFSQIGGFELLNALSAARLRFYSVKPNGPSSYQLEEIV
jgi:hypothetical protein